MSSEALSSLALDLSAEQVCVLEVEPVYNSVSKVMPVYRSCGGEDVKLPVLATVLDLAIFMCKFSIANAKSNSHLVVDGCVDTMFKFWRPPTGSSPLTRPVYSHGCMVVLTLLPGAYRHLSVLLTFLFVLFISEHSGVAWE